MGINDFLKSCVKRSDGSLLCWDYETKQYIVVELKRVVVSITDLTEEELVSLKKKVDSEGRK